MSGYYAYARYESGTCIRTGAPKHGKSLLYALMSELPTMETKQMKMEGKP